MKITVITDGKGAVLGTQRPSEGHTGAATHGPTPSATIVAGPGQHVTEIDVPNEALKGSVEDLHRAIARQLKK